jgi:hypothetical protein
LPEHITASRLAAAQNTDGGWGYGGASSWTEPTAYAVLALDGASDNAAAVSRARRWLAANQRADGGVAPRPSVAESTWVTAPALLAAALQGDAGHRAVEWLLAQRNENSTLIYRLRQWMLGNQAFAENDTPGWSWYPGTAAWVVPTSITVLALGKAARRNPEARLRERIELGRRLLLSRICEDGGWNHGSTRALGFQAVSYPETTGIALLALAGADRARLAKSIARAEEHLRTCRSLEGLSWLRMGLLAQGLPAPEPPPDIPARTFMDRVVSLLASRAAEGRNPLLEATT